MSTLKNQFDLHTRLFNNVLDGISDAESNERANDHVNHIKWLAGHLTSSRFAMTANTPNPQEDPYGEMFGHGKGLDPNADYPSVESIKANWNAISTPISEALANLPAEALQAEAPNVPIPGGTMEAFLEFLMHHEAYHIGQLGILRKYLGKESMSYAEAVTQ